MKIELCKKSLERLGPAQDDFTSALREREHSLAVKDCLNRCQGCTLGLYIAVADGAPLSSKTPEKLLADIDTLAEDEP